MTAKKTRSAPAVAFLSDTALPAVLHFPSASSEPDSEVLSEGLSRTLARSRDGIDAPARAKASALARLAKSDASAKAKPVRGMRKANVGPRSGHK